MPKPAKEGAFTGLATRCLHFQIIYARVFPPLDYGCDKQGLYFVFLALIAPNTKLYLLKQFAEWKSR